ncbi:MAG: dephospho-CoA kinase [Phycisphaerales bacterium]|nr:dephospho-CoA kinase [Phycisphaerales bacterium]
MGRHRIPVIGLTGGIGSGKSQVAMMLQSLGCVVADADAMAKESLQMPAVIQQLQNRWGDRVCSSEGGVDRETIASIVFQDESERRWLESVIHPLVHEQREALFAAAPQDAVALVIDAPLLLEAGLDSDCDAILFIDTPEEIRQKRLQRDRGWEPTELSRREAAQISLDEKRSMAHHVVCNDGEVEDLARSVEAYLETLISDFSSRPDN